MPYFIDYDARNFNGIAELMQFILEYSALENSLSNISTETKAQSLIMCLFEKKFDLALKIMETINESIVFSEHIHLRALNECIENQEVFKKYVSLLDVSTLERSLYYLDIRKLSFEQLKLVLSLGISPNLALNNKSCLLFAVAKDPSKLKLVLDYGANPQTTIGNRTIYYDCPVESLEILKNYQAKPRSGDIKRLLSENSSQSVATLDFFIKRQKFSPTSQNLVHLWEYYFEGKLSFEIYWQKFEMFLNSKSNFGKQQVRGRTVVLAIALSEKLLGQGEKMEVLKNTISRLIAKGFEINPKKPRKEYPHLADSVFHLLRNDCYQTAKILLEAGACPKKSWRIPIDRELLDQTCVAQFYDMLAPYGELESRHQVLFEAFRLNRHKVCKVLVFGYRKYGIDLSKTDDNGKSIADYATEMFSSEFVKLLLKDSEDKLVAI